MKISAMIKSVLVVGISFSVPVQAALLARDLNKDTIIDAYYDTEVGITWLSNANLLASNTFGLTYGQNYGSDSYGNPSVIQSNGLATWGGAQAWITAMNANGYMGYHDWRLPITLQPDVTCDYQFGGVSYGPNCTGSEMGNLFYQELGGTAGLSILTSSDPDVVLFSNIQPYYWSDTLYIPGTHFAWVFLMNNGNQGAYDENDVRDHFYAWAVRTGDVAIVPEPGTTMLLALGLVGLVTMRRR